MEENFKHYGAYYDLLYQDKDYVAETNYIVSIINSYAPKSKTILELGSGTGKHARLIAQSNFTIVGVERSAEMLAIARQFENPNISYIENDITDFTIAQKFDVVLSLFHVISYLSTNEALIQAFQHANRHLNNDGLFIFDVWHSAAVNSQQPEKRKKVLKNDVIEVTRYAYPIIYSERNLVEVNYDIHIRQLENNSLAHIHEKHTMRHFSKPEIELLAYFTGFKVIHTEEFLSKKEPSVDSWGVCYILQKLN